jgi:hypothetical protein
LVFIILPFPLLTPHPPQLWEGVRTSILALFDVQKFLIAPLEIGETPGTILSEGKGEEKEEEVEEEEEPKSISV